jgi:septal ring factor EnvC (AmiA/AmiB activator)
MRRLALLGLAPFLLSAADPVALARAEAARSEREVQRLERLAAGAKTAAERLAAEQTAAAETMIAAEAELSATEERARRIGRLVQAREARLAERQRPAAAMLAGLVEIGRRPPLLALAGGTSAREFVTMRAILDTSLPVIRARTAALRADVEQGRRLAEAAASARHELQQQRRELQESQVRLAELERRANAQFQQLGGQALYAGDLAISRSAASERVGREEGQRRSASRLAAVLAGLPDAPARPSEGDGGAAPPPLAWQMPIEGPVLNGLSEISDSGVRSRGLTVGSGRGAPVLAPADGKIAYSGPFRRHAGVVIIDHGRGWMTMMTEVRTALPTGARVQRGTAIGRALGPATVELSRDGRPQPAALIAGSSASLSKGRHNS